MGDLDLGVAGEDLDGGEAVVAVVVWGEGVVSVDVPGGVVAEVEDEELADGGVDGERVRSGAGLGVGRWRGVGVGGEPVGWVGVGEGVVVGGDGSVLVGGLGAEVGVEERYAGGYVVLFVAGLVEQAVGGDGEGGCDDESDRCGDGGFDVDGAEEEGHGEAEDCGEDGEDAPGELEEG